MKFKPLAVLAVVESVKGTDEVPTAAANAIETVEATIQPLQGEQIEHRVDRKQIGAYLKTLVGRHVTVSFKVALASSGTAGDAPGWGVLQKGCGMKEAVTVGTDARYEPDLDNQDTLSLYFYVEKTLHKMVYATGNWSLEVGAKQYPYLSYEFTGLFVDPVADVIPSDIDLSGFTKPIAMTNANTTFSIHGFSAALTRLRLNLNNQVEHIDVPGEEATEILDQNIGGQCNIYAPELSAHNFFNDVKDSTLGDFSWQIGSAAGKIVKIQNTGRTQVETINYDNQNQRRGHPLGLSMQPDPSGTNPPIEIVVE